MDLGLEQIAGQFEKLARLPRQYRLAVVCALPVLVLCAYAYLFYAPAQGELAQLRSQQQQLQRKLSEVRTVAANVSRFQVEIASLERKLGVALQQLPNDKELPELLTNISSLGKNAGLEFKSFRPKQEIDHEFYAEVPIDLELTGHFQDVAHFFDEVSRLSRIVDVNQLEISIAGEGSEETLLDVRGEATTFRFVEAAKGKGPAAGARARRRLVRRPRGRRG